MISLTTPPTCDEKDWLCGFVLETTHNVWLATAADWLIAKPVAVLVIVLLGFLARWVANKLIDRLIRRTIGGTIPGPVLRSRAAARSPEQHRQVAAAAERRRQRAQTLASVLGSVASFVIFSIVAIMALAVIGLDVGPMIASAGLIGVALGFGAQNLVRDFLSGLFMFFEDQCGVGDRVIIGETEGVVEALALRITRVRADDGTVWYMRNGEILKVGNISQGGETPNLSEKLSTPEEEQQAAEAAQVEKKEP